MAVNGSYAGTAPGFFKILHIIFGAIAIGCGSQYDSEFVFERVFLWSAVTCFILSIVYLLGHLMSKSLAQSSAVKGFDVVYHILAGILLLVGGSLMIASVKKYDKQYCDPNPWGVSCQERKSVKLAGGSFSIINGIFYLITVALIGMQKKEDPDINWDTRIRGYQAASAKEKTPVSEPRE
ncbi:uncharacterized protein LOC110863385 [Folsomia candida]|uniref:MARVEL domain-containing protein n=1 Tax=Folsomia candida TaxID=158441 RepID=A0A226EV30_FOLCA|nr:uncharacterized protein LOC110863385 [Folsomia candida]OXA61442.1 hypothetical protein Fcan01_02016 [Folsomia candida]